MSDLEILRLIEQALNEAFDVMAKDFKVLEFGETYIIIGYLDHNGASLTKKICVGVDASLLKALELATKRLEEIKSTVGIDEELLTICRNAIKKAKGE